MLILFLLSFLPADYPENLFFQGTVQEALVKAQQEKKLIVVDVFTTWCGPCKLMDRQTFSDEKVIRLLTGDKVFGYKINAERGEGIALARKYKVRGYPCILILDGDGQLVDKYLGFMNVQRFLRFVRSNI